MGIPEGFVAIASLGEHVDFDVGELPSAELGIDFNVREIALPDGDHGEGAHSLGDRHFGKSQIGV